MQILQLTRCIMSDCSLIATRNSHAKHNKSVRLIPQHGERELHIKGMN